MSKAETLLRMDAMGADDIGRLKVRVSGSIFSANALAELRAIIELQTCCKTTVVDCGGFFFKEYVLKVEGKKGELYKALRLINAVE